MRFFFGSASSINQMKSEVQGQRRGVFSWSGTRIHEPVMGIIHRKSYHPPANGGKLNYLYGHGEISQGCVALLPVKTSGRFPNWSK